MKLLEFDERYSFECCRFVISVNNGAVTLEAKKKEGGWHRPKLAAVRYCPDCGAEIPNKGKDTKDNPCPVPGVMLDPDP